MTIISKLALGAILAVSSFHADSFTVVPSHGAPCRTTSLIHSSRRRPSLTVAPLRSTASDEDQKSTSTSLKRLPNSAVELTLHVPPTATQAAYDKTLATVSKKISIPGFRKGAKIPSAVIENAWSAQGGKKALKTMAINELCGELIAPALKDEYQLEPIGQPTLVTPAETLAETLTPGQGALEVVVRCDVWPDIRWKRIDGKETPYVGLKGKYKRRPFDRRRFDAALRDLTERYARLEPHGDADHALVMGDACVVDMVGYMATHDGNKGEKLPEAASGDNVEVILGTGRYMEGLVEGLLGGKVGEVKTVKVRFPQVSLFRCAVVSFLVMAPTIPFSRRLRNPRPPHRHSKTKTWPEKTPSSTSPSFPHRNESSPN